MIIRRGLHRFKSVIVVALKVTNEMYELTFAFERLISSSGHPRLVVMEVRTLEIDSNLFLEFFLYLFAVKTSSSVLTVTLSIHIRVDDFVVLRNTLAGVTIAETRPAKN